MRDSFLTIVSDPWLERRRSRVMVRCLCGKIFSVTVNSIKTGNTTSCGCKRKKSLLIRNTKHGLSARGKRHPLYKCWASIIQRCTNPNNTKYADYGGRGISICDRWRNSFEAFVTDVGPRPFLKAELERKNNDSGYSPDNVCWSTRATQMRNTRNNRYLVMGGERLTITDWARRIGLSASAIRHRLKKMSVEEALTKKKMR